jgi:23S rRNA (uracil1939-C5)-methyltransferase
MRVQAGQSGRNSMPTDTFDITLTTLAYGGDALGRLPDGAPRPGLAVFVPCALPGETVRVRLVAEKRGHARAELLEVLTPSPDRVTPRCPHFYSPIVEGENIGNMGVLGCGASQHTHISASSPPSLPIFRGEKGGDAAKLRSGDGRGNLSATGAGVGWCGGCHYQHIAYPAQLAAKTAILREQLERLGGIKDPSILPPVPSPSPWNYRNQVQFYLTPQGRLGYEALRSNRLLPIRECHLPETPINQLWPQLDLEPLTGLERVSLRVGADEELMLILEGGDPQSMEFVIEGLPISAVHLGPAGPLVLAGSDHILMEVGNLDALGSVGAGSSGERAVVARLHLQPVPTQTRLFCVSAESFFQVNTPQAGAMVDHLLANLPLTPSATLLDVYCGAGLFSAFLAPHVERLIGIESSPSACQDFVCNLDEFDNVELYEAAAEQVLPAFDLRADVILAEPPHAGLSPRTLDGLLSLDANTLAYVSSDPATLGRDARRLIGGGYHLRQITPFDLFPQTCYIESISFWER